MEKSKKISINLSSKHKLSVTNAFYRWAFEAGRAIVVLIELIALGALGYRFMVDSDIVDLHDEIRKQEQLVAFQEEDEMTYRGIQERLESIKIIGSETSGKVEVMNEILSAIQEGILTDTNLSISLDSISLSGTTLSVFALENFVNGMQEFEQISSISIDEITTSDSGIKFKISVRIKTTDLTS